MSPTCEFASSHRYPVSGDVIIRNKLRAAYMWMDEYAVIANNVMGNLPEGKSLGSLEWARLRQTCRNGGPSHSFKWLLTNVYPEFNDVLGTCVCTPTCSTSSTGADQHANTRHPNSDEDWWSPCTCCSCDVCFRHAAVIFEVLRS
jgi:hypothetical protein